MRRALRAMSVVLFTALGLFLIAFGVLYASVRELLWFHAAAVPAEALDGVRPIYFALMKLIGGASGALGLLGAYVALFPVRRGSLSATIALGVCFALPLVVAAIVAENLAAATGSPTSWHIMGVLLGVDALAVVAFLAGGRTKT